MTPMEIAVDGLRRNLEMLNATVADFSEAEFLTRPCPRANHTAWMIGHLIASEGGMLWSVDAKAVAPLPKDLWTKFTKETAANDDASFFPNKGQLLDLFTKTRQATIAWAKTLTPTDLEKPAPEKMRNYVPTVGHMLFLIPGHVAMHVGQMQVIRRKLNKPYLF